MRGIFSDLTMAPLLRVAVLVALAAVCAVQGQQPGLLRVPDRSAPTGAFLDRVVLPVDNAGGFAGWWTVLSENSGVSAMHLAIMRHGKAVMFDTTTTGPSLSMLPAGNCRPDPRSVPPGAMDCSAHAVEFDYNTGAVRPLKVGLPAPLFSAPMWLITTTVNWPRAADPDRHVVLVGGVRPGGHARANRRLLRRGEGCETPEPTNHFRLEGVPQ
jgi:hypothetical protein